MIKTKKFTTRNLFLCLFAILYLSVAAVSTFHAFHFFGLANNSVMAAMLAGTFEIGQAAVLFSLLTDSENRKKYIPWTLMCILTLVQVLGNVFSSYEYIITNSMDNLRYFKEPIFIWTNLPDEQANVIVTYIQGSLLPIVCLLLTSMVTSYLSKEKKNTNLNEDNISKDNNLQNVSLEDENKNEDIDKEEHIKDEKQIENTLDLQNKDIVEEEPVGEKEINEEPIKKEFVKQIETPLDLQNEQHKSSKPSHFINL